MEPWCSWSDDRVGVERHHHPTLGSRVPQELGVLGTLELSFMNMDNIDAPAAEFCRCAERQTLVEKQADHADSRGMTSSATCDAAKVSACRMSSSSSSG